MKNSILVLVVMVFAYAGYGQVTFKPGIGLNFTDFSKDQNGDAKAQVGWQLGASVAYGTKWYVEPGLFYVSKSTEFTSTDSLTTDFDSDISGVRIPVAVGINALGNVSTGIALRVFGGPSMFLITGTGDDINKDSIETFNFGLFAGAGIDFWKLFLDISYEWSMTNIQKNVSQIDLGKTRTLYITAGIRLNFKKK